MTFIKITGTAFIILFFNVNTVAQAENSATTWQALKNWGVQQWSSATATMPRTPITVPAQGSIEVAFSPPGGATAAIVRALGEARQRVWIQAYSFTSAPIAKAVLAAARRGVNVQVVLDKSQRTQKYSVADFFANQGVPVYIDDQHAIAHNKVMVIDSGTLITGSFNFSKAAEQANAENLLIFRDNPVLQKLYADNFRFHLSHSTAYQPRHGRD
ncbi:MAG: phospholipase D family protein [Acidithiobacillus sp.]